MEKNYFKERILPFTLAILVIIIDQITKALVVKLLPIQPGTFFTYGPSFFGDFLNIIHIRNTGVAFSFGANWGETARRILFSIIPLIVLVVLIFMLLKSNEYTKLQRWSIAGIIGGGFGNIIDRIFRAEGVVDFIDVKWFGLDSKITLLNMKRWPTFNIADAAVVVCGITLAVSMILGMVKESKNQKSQ